jgi:hypothetical protein
MQANSQPLHPCPCCGFLVFDQPAGSYDICPVCGWEDDPVQLHHPLIGGANPPLAQEQPRALAALTSTALAALTAQGRVRCPDWRPLCPADFRPDESMPRSGLAGSGTLPNDPPPYYWQRGSTP